MWNHLHVESRIQHKEMGQWNKNRFTDIKNILVAARKWGRVGGGWIGSLGLAIYRMDKQQGPTV